LKNLYCSAPWRGLHITTRGEVKPCCAGSHGFGNINDDNIEDILNVVEWQQLRQQIAADIVPSYCGKCERNGLASERSWHNMMSPNLTELGTAHHGPAILDVRWSNACNLSCIYCNPFDSSMWAKKLNFPLLTKRKDYYTNIIDYVQANQQHLRSAAFIGGEPLLIPQCAELIDALPDTVTCQVITNLSMDLETNPVFKKLATRKNVSWGISFENVGKQFEYVRRGASWNQLTKNILILKELENTHNHTLDIHTVLNILSLDKIDEIIKFGIDQQIVNVINFLETPAELDLRRFPAHIVNAIRIKIQPAYELMNIADRDSVDDYFKRNLSPSNNQVIGFYRFIQKMDTDELKFSELWPDLHNLLSDKNPGV
jgi:MoaA/NifB/PqqE/SkfB family radical SAM enzyme